MYSLWKLTLWIHQKERCLGQNLGRNPGRRKRKNAAWLSWPPLWWGVISFQNFRTRKLGIYFCVDFLASSELIGHLDLMDSYEIWPKCSLVINAQKCVRLFWFSKYFFLLRTLMWRRSANVQFANFKIDFLSNQSEHRKSLTHVCSLLPTDWHCADCLVVRVSRKEGNSVSKQSQFCVWRLACAYH